MSLAGRTFSSLRVAPYRRFYAGNVLSLLGFWIRITVQGWLVYELTDSEAWLGAVTAISILPLVVVSPWGGVLADRVDRRLILMTVPLVSVASNVFLGVMYLAGVLRIEHIALAAAAIGAARAVEIPFRNAFVRDLVGLDELPNAVALNAAGFNVARVAGPGLGGILLVLLDYGPCFLVAAVLNLSMIVAVSTLRDLPTTAGAPRGGAWRQLAEGFRYVRTHRRTRTLFLMFSITLLCTWTYQSMMPAFVRDRLGEEVGTYTVLLTVIGLGALVGALWVAGRVKAASNRRRTVFLLVWTGALCVFILGFVRETALAVPLFLITGFCQVAFFATANGLVQVSVPDALRGRVMGLWTFTFGASFPLGSVLMGAVAESFGLPWAWCGGAVAMILLTAILRWTLPPPEVAEAEREAEADSPPIEPEPAA